MERPQQFISITRLRIDNPTDGLVRELQRYMQGALTQALAISTEMPQIKVEKAGQTIIFYTLSAWDSEETMVSFRDQGAHRSAMEKFCDLGEIESHHWYTDEDEVPTWENAIRKLDEEIVRRRRQKGEGK